ncbi:hypothetical protein TNCV_1262981 [Trichonephila clavipes]|nr:hypothetical protein TNCV_1262981 [Trichonephila clavipes]
MAYFPDSSNFSYGMLRILLESMIFIPVSWPWYPSVYNQKPLAGVLQVLVVATPSEGVNINVALFSYTMAFGDGPCNFEPWSSDEDDT